LTYGIPEIHAARPFVESVQGISAREALPLRRCGRRESVASLAAMQVLTHPGD
jgi:hypothetical protein